MGEFKELLYFGDFVTSSFLESERPPPWTPIPRLVPVVGVAQDDGARGTTVWPSTPGTHNPTLALPPARELWDGDRTSSLLA